MQSIASFEITATAPVNPIEEFGILSVHCQVWDLPKEHEVRLLRSKSSGDTLSISVKDIVMTSDERYFLAKRQLEGGSFVYFMSIMDVTREDEGKYMCKVYNTSKGSMIEIGEDSIDFEITYFPSDSELSCSSSTHENKLEFYAGIEITLMCSSEKANPPVSLEWRRTKPGHVYKVTQHERDASVYSELTITLEKRHSGTMFSCRATSKAFPGRMSTCHIGPITVLSNPDNISPDTPDYDNIDDIDDTIISVDTSSTREDTDVTIVHKSKDCHAYCSSSSLLFQWIVSTVVAASLAFIFFILGIILLIKYHRANIPSDYCSSRSLYATTRTERIYSELECKRQESQNSTSYMYLHHPKPLNQDIRETASVGNYDSSQNMGKN